MNTLLIILAVVNIIIAVAIVFLVLQQDSDDQGLGTISGSNNESFYSENKGRTRDVLLRKITTGLLITFIVINVVVGMILG